MPEILLYGPIGKGWDPFSGEPAISANDFVRSLDMLEGQDFTLRVNSDGGDVFEAKAMMEAISRYPGRVTAEIDAIAASAASFLIMTADEILMSPGSVLMIHSPWTIAVGNENELRSTANTLQLIRESTIQQAYLARGLDVSAEQLAEMLADETWMDADEAVRLGFADGLTRSAREPVAALLRPELFGKVPPQFAAKPLQIKPKDLRTMQKKTHYAAMAARMRENRARREDSFKDLTKIKPVG